jgi:hypothetical protein
MKGDSNGTIPKYGRTINLIETEGLKMKFKILGLLIAFAFLISCSSIHHNEPKIYVSGMEPMMGKDTNTVLSEIEDKWKFKCSKFWTTQDPTLKDVSKEIKGKIAFTEQEAGQIFSPKGEYKVMVFLKLLGKENLTIGTISSLGQGLPQAGKGYADKRSAYIRVVFRDDKLVHFHVWRD